MDFWRLDRHLSDRSLRTILDEWTSGETTEPDAVHLVICERCRRRCLELAPRKARMFLRSMSDVIVSPDELSEETTQKLIEMVQRHEAECDRGHYLAGELLRCPRGRARRELVRAIDPPIRPAALANGIRVLLPSLVHDHPEDIIDLAGLGVELLNRQARGAMPRTTLDLAADLEAQCGNAYRLLSNPRAARQHLNQAGALAAESPDCLLQARVAVLTSLLFRDTRNFEPAERFASQALSIYREVGDDVEVARIEFLQATILYFRSDFEAVAEKLRALLDRDLDAITRLSIVAWLAETYFHLDERFRAVGLLSEVRRLAGQFSSPSITVHLDWLRGLLLGNGGLHQRAETLLTRVREFFLQRGKLIESALATLDLADLHVSRGRHREAADAASAIIGAFEVTKSHQEALAALRLYVEAEKSARRQVGRELRLFLPMAEMDPSFKYTPGCMIAPDEG